MGQGRRSSGLPGDQHVEGQGREEEPQSWLWRRQDSEMLNNKSKATVVDQVARLPPCLGLDIVSMFNWNKYIYIRHSIGSLIESHQTLL